MMIDNPVTDKDLDFYLHHIPDQRFGSPDLCANLTQPQFERVIVKNPTISLKYAHICNRLTDTQFSYCLKYGKACALAFTHATKRLDSTQFNDCVQKRPHTALIHQHACDLLSDVQFSYCVKRAPYYALRSQYACKRLSDIQFDECIKSEVNEWQGIWKSTLVYIIKRMNPYQKAAIPIDLEDKILWQPIN